MNIQVTPTSIGGQSFSGESNYFASIELNTIQTINIQMGNRVDHPFHMHVNHFQIISNGNNVIDVPNGYQMIGDWSDTYVGPGQIKFKTHAFGGTVTMHCHILEHEDEGAMGTLLITSGCDNDLVTDFGTPGSCVYNTTQCGIPIPTSSPTTAPPSQTPTTSTPTSITSFPTKAPSAAPTNSSTTSSTSSHTISLIIILLPFTLFILFT